MGRNEILWTCTNCHENFRYSTGAIEHAAVNEDADIWPSYE